MHKIRRFISVLVAAVTMITACACGSSSTAGLPKTEENNKKKILLTIADTQTGTHGAFATAVRQEGRKEGFSVTVKETYGTLDTQVKQIRMAKKHGFGGIICWAVDPDAALQLEIAADGLPIVFVNNRPDDDTLQAGSYVYVGSDDKTAGEYQAEYVYETLGKPDKLNIMILKGDKQAVSTADRTNAVKNYFADKGVDLNIVFSDFGNDSQETTDELLQSFEKTKQFFSAAICNNDDMALGVIQYMQEKNMNAANIPVCGIDGTDDALKSISTADGMSFTVLEQSDKQAAAAIKAIKALKSGSGIENIDGATKDGKYIWIPLEKVDRKNVSKYLKDK